MNRVAELAHPSPRWGGTEGGVGQRTRELEFAPNPRAT
jgi:hypothetical protein